jgi:hypothetical protein
MPTGSGVTARSGARSTSSVDQRGASTSYSVLPDLARAAHIGLLGAEPLRYGDRMARQWWVALLGLLPATTGPVMSAGCTCPETDGVPSAYIEVRADPGQYRVELEVDADAFEVIVLVDTDSTTMCGPSCHLHGATTLAVHVQADRDGFGVFMVDDTYAGRPSSATLRISHQTSAGETLAYEGTVDLVDDVVYPDGYACGDGFDVAGASIELP